jgi:hypothetical protein
MFASNVMVPMYFTAQIALYLKNQTLYNEVRLKHSLYEFSDNIIYSLFFEDY